MSKNKLWILACATLLSPYLQAQPMRLSQILDSIAAANPVAAMYETQARAQDEASNGAKSWMPPEFSAGLWMTPYNPRHWKKGTEHNDTGEGSFMLSGQQIFPNKRRQAAEQAYMQAMSGVTLKQKDIALQDLYAQAKKAYCEYAVIAKKQQVLAENEQILAFMLQNATQRYQTNQEQLSAHYRIQAAQGELQLMRVMLNNQARQQCILLATLMNAPAAIEPDTSIALRNISDWAADPAAAINARSDVQALTREIQVTALQAKVEETRLLPEFGVRYDHMLAWGGQPWQFSLMGMVRLPLARWSAPMYKANQESLKWKALSLQNQQQMILLEAKGMSQTLQAEWQALYKQVEVYEQAILPALRKNLQANRLAYEQNTAELPMFLEAWDQLNTTYLSYWDVKRQLLLTQVEMERLLEIK